MRRHHCTAADIAADTDSGPIIGATTQPMTVQSPTPWNGTPIGAAPDESPAEQPAQLPLWADEPPEEAGPLLDAIERLRAHAWAYVDSTLQEMAAASNMRSILQRQASMIAAMRTSLHQPRRLPYSRISLGRTTAHCKRQSWL